MFWILTRPSRRFRATLGKYVLICVFQACPCPPKSRQTCTKFITCFFGYSGQVLEFVICNEFITCCQVQKDILPAILLEQLLIEFPFECFIYACVPLLNNVNPFLYSTINNWVTRAVVHSTPIKSRKSTTHMCAKTQHWTRPFMRSKTEGIQ